MVRRLFIVGMSCFYALLSVSALAQNAQPGFVPGQVGQVSLAPAAPVNADPNIDSSLDFCQSLQPENFSIDGQKVQRYPLAELKYLQCFKSGEPQAPWIVTKTQWADSDQLEWQNFVHNMGLEVEQGLCNTVDGCMVSKGNVYRSAQDFAAHYYSDCAKFPMFLRAYFSFKNSLPFSFVYEVQPNPLTPQQQAEMDQRQAQAAAQGPDVLAQYTATASDIRYTRNGNYPTERVNVPQRSGQARREFYSMLNTMYDGVSTANYRMFQPTGTDVLPDYYSPAINTEAIKPGSLLYNADGHVALVYDIRPNGVIMTLNAAPGNALAVRQFDSEFARSIPNHGAGFKNWRPFQLLNPMMGTGDQVADIIGGDIEFYPDNQIPDFSPEQYYGNQPSPDGDWSKGIFTYNNAQVDWMDFVKLRLSNGVFKLDPLFEFRKDLSAVCQSLQDRIPYVTSAMGPHANGPVAQQPHPDHLPNNIYGADGDWESFSSPGRDLRIRQDVQTLIGNLAAYKQKWSINDPAFEYTGKNLKSDLEKVFFESDAACQISYPNSSGQNVTIPSLSLALSRLPYMSYDPYDCPELRWGATSSAELKTCVMDPVKMDWYTSQQFLRNQMSRDSEALMGWDLPTLKTMSTPANSHVDTSMFDVFSALEAL